jgi:hypothetical protein
MHFLNMPSLMEGVFTLMKSFAKDKMRQRLHVHAKKDKYTGLHEALGKDILPLEYGGTNGKLQDHIGDGSRRVASSLVASSRVESLPVKSRQVASSRVASSRVASSRVESRRVASSRTFTQRGADYCTPVQTIQKCTLVQTLNVKQTKKVPLGKDTSCRCK